MSNFCEDSQIFNLSQLRLHKSLLPRERGVYGLYFDMPPGIAPVEGCFVRAGLHLMYIGSAGADLSKNGNLRGRLGVNHLGGNERRSTLCQTLAALMPEIAGKCVEKLEGGVVKFHTSSSGIKAVQSWMDKHVSAVWMTHLNPASLEKQLIARYQLPLNLDDNSHHTFAPELER